MDTTSCYVQKNFRCLLVSVFLISFCFSMQNNTLPLYILELGGTSFHVGIMAGISSITALFFRTIAGYFLDNKGRNLVFTTGIWLYLLATAGYILAPNTIFLLLSRSLYGLGLCAATSSTAAIASDLIPERLTNALYTISVVQTSGGLFAPALAIFLAGKIGYDKLYIITGAGFFAALITAYFINYEKNQLPVKPDAKYNPSAKNKLAEMFEISAIFPALCMVFHGIAHSSIAGFVVSYGKSLGIQNVGFFFIINGLTTFAIRPILGRYSDDVYRNKVFGTGSCFFVGALLLFLFSKNAVWIAIASVLFTVGYNSTQPLLNSLAIKNAPSHRKGVANSTYYIFWDFGYGVGAVALGSVATQWGYHSIYFIGIFSLLIMAVIYRRFIANKRTDYSQRT